MAGGRIGEVEQKYLVEKKKLFPRDVLQKILEARQRGDRSIEVPDYVEGTYTLEVDLGYNYDTGSVKMIQYLPIQRLMNPGLHQTLMLWWDRDVNPIHNVVRNSQLNCNFGESLHWKGFEDMWKASREPWDKSTIRRLLMETFKNVPPQQLGAVKQIVAFGFGSFDIVFQWNRTLMLDLPRHEQMNLIVSRHHAIQDVQKIVERTGHEVKVFLQDDAFTTKDKEMLSKLQFRSLEDPAGYLQIDKNTLVVFFDEEVHDHMQCSVNAGMQVLADIAETENAPAMILHKKIEQEDWNDYKTEEVVDGIPGPSKGRSIDSTSPRVQALIEQYEEVDFMPEELQRGDPPVFFPHARLYIRKGLGGAGH